MAFHYAQECGGVEKEKRNERKKNIIMEQYPLIRQLFGSNWNICSFSTIKDAVKWKPPNPLFSMWFFFQFLFKKACMKSSHIFYAGSYEMMIWTWFFTSENWIKSFHNWFVPPKAECENHMNYETVPLVFILILFYNEADSCSNNHFHH